MRRIFNFLLCSAVLLTISACSKNESNICQVEEPSADIMISLRTEEYGLSPKTRSATEIVAPEIGSLKVEIFKMTETGQVRLYKDTYENTLGKRILLNCADYRLMASHGDSLAAGFDKPYFRGITDFTLAPQQSQLVETVVKVSNVRVSVAYGDNLVYDYPEFYSIVRTVTKGGKKRSLKFYSDEKRAGFVPAGQVTLELYAKIDGQWKYFCSEPLEAIPGDDLTFNVETKRLESEVGFNVTVVQPDEQSKEISLNQDIYPADSPEIDSNEFGGTMLFTEGDQPREDLKVDIVAEGEVKECWLSVQSDYLANQGVPTRVDLADPEMDTTLKNALEAIGVRWMPSMKGRKFSYVDFSGVSRYLTSTECDPSNMFNATFSVEIIDSRHGVEDSTHQGTSKSDVMTFIQGVPTPSISVEGFADSPVVVMEAVETAVPDLKAHIKTKGGLAKCILSIDSPYLLAAGVPVSVDLANVDVPTAKLLRSVGIDWDEGIAGSKVAEVDFTGVVDYMENAMYSASKGYDFARFGIMVENGVSREGNIKDASASVGEFIYIIPSSPTTTNNYKDLDVRARRMNNYSTVLQDGNFSAWGLQYSTDGKTWNQMPTSVTGSTLLCQEVTGLSSTATAGVTHSVRAIYHNNPDISYLLSSFTTEPAAQVPNSNFDTWQIAPFTYYLDKVWGMGGNNTSRNWYLPWTNDANRVWDVNSRKTMPANTTPREQDFKVFPAVSYSVDTPDGSGACAQMVGVYISNMATSGSDGDGLGGTLGGLFGGVDPLPAQTSGEIFIGTADASGNHSTEGCPFGSRPDKLRFSYKYTSKNSEKYLVTARLMDAEENVVAEGEMEGSAASSWSTAELALQYDESLNIRPTTIYISFKAASCADSDVYHDRNVTIEMAGSNFKGHIGSILKVDNVELIYQ